MNAPAVESAAPGKVAAEAIPEGFEPVVNEAFMETVGPIYVRRNDAGAWDLGCLALPRHANRFGAVHGGMLATLVDYAIGLNLLEAGAPDIRLGTVSLNIDFISAGLLGEWLLVRVQIDKSQGRLRFCSCAMYGSGGRLVLRASGVFSAAPLSK